MSLTSNITVFFTFVLFVLWASYTDVTEMKIRDNLNIFAVLARLVFVPIFPLTGHHIVGGAVLFVVFLIVGMINIKNNMGGDIKFSGAFGLWTGIYLGLSSVLIGVFLIIPVSIIRKRPVPLAPFLAIGFIITYTLSAVFQ